MRPDPALIPVLIAHAKTLKGSLRRLFMAQTVKAMGRGGQRWAQEHLGWCRETIRKGTHELESGLTCVDAFSLRRRKPVEEHLPRLLDDIREIVDGQSQIDPKFQTDRLFTRISAAEVRKQLIAQKGYTDEQLPTQQTINTKLNLLGYRLTKVDKCRPQKKLKQTDPIFEQLKQVNPEADRADDTLRISIDAKATVNIGPFSRRGKSRTKTKGADHDFKPEATLTPFGIFLPQYDDLWLYMARSKITSDFIVDRLEQWWQEVRLRFLGVKALVINLDNGPENHSRRTQFLKRIVEFARKSGLRIRLAYYPPYHSKYNAIERCWGILENHWNGSLLDSIEAVLGFAGTMTWKGKSPRVSLVETSYAKGVRLTPKQMEALESEVVRLPSLKKWFVEIPGHPRELWDG
jgi:transposase